MKTSILGLSAAGLLFAASSAQATSTESDRYADWAQARSEILLRAAGVDGDQAVSVRASVNLAGRITRVRVLQSSGSRHTDAAVAAVLRQVIRSKPPSGLENGAVTLNVGEAAIVQAKAR